MKGAAKWVFGLHLLLLAYSGSAILSKLAAEAPFPSLEFFSLYAGVLIVLGAYAIGWQQILKRLPLTFAFSNKAIVVFWGVFWGFLLFGESITMSKAIGCLIIVVGVIIFSRESYDDSISVGDD